MSRAATGAPQIVATYAYGPFGEQTGQTGSHPLASRNPLRYRRYYADGATGLYYLPARYYDPGVARFLSKDPAPPQAGDPRSLNAYAYCMGDPVNLEDPSGAIADYDGNGRVDSWDSAWSASRHASHWRRRDEFRQRAVSRHYSAELARIPLEDRLDPGSVALLGEQARRAEQLGDGTPYGRGNMNLMPSRPTVETWGMATAGTTLDFLPLGPGQSAGLLAGMVMDGMYVTQVAEPNRKEGLGTAGDVAFSTWGAVPYFGSGSTLIILTVDDWLQDTFGVGIPWAEPEGAN